MKKENSVSKNKCSLRDIAEKLGISKGAVSLALNDSNKISKQTKIKVKQTASKLGYKTIPVVSRVMSSIKNKSQSGFLETIVLINANLAKNAAEKYQVFAKYINGINEEAQELGYVVYQIWLHDKTLTPEKLRNILISRGIRGGIVIGHMDDNILPDIFSDIWHNFKFVSAGLRTLNPVLDFISADKFLIARYATSKVISLGYRRPALIIDKHIDDLVEGRFIGGFLRAQLELFPEERIEPFTKTSEAKKDRQVIVDWLDENRPDAVFTLSKTTTDWIETDSAVKKEILKHARLVKFEPKANEDDWIAIDKNYELIGRLAVRKLFEVLNTPTRLKDINVPTATIVQPRWNRSILK